VLIKRPASLSRSAPAPHGPRLLKLRSELGLGAGVSEAIACLHETPGASLDETARRLHSSRRSLQRELQREGVSFRTLRQAVRVTLAAQLLRASDRSLTELALEAGFFDSAHFTRAFGAACGVTPSAYRSWCRPARLAPTAA